MTTATTGPVMLGKPVRFNLPGTPQQQGSKIRNRNGSSREANPNLAPWRADAIAAMQADYDGPKIIDPISVDATFMFARPRSHYGTGRNHDQIKPTAPFYKPTAPDLDKLCRAVGDALTQAGVILDDRLIVHWSAGKCFTGAGPCTQLFIWNLAGDPQ